MRREEKNGGIQRVRIDCSSKMHFFFFLNEGESVMKQGLKRNMLSEWIER